MNYKYRPILIIILVFSLLLAACGKEEPEQTTTTQAPTTTTETQPVETEPSESEPEQTETENETDGPAQEEPVLLWQQGHENGLYSTASSPDGLYIAVGEYLTTYIYRAADGVLADVRTYAHSVENIEYFPDSSRLANGLSVGGVVITNLEDDTELTLHSGNNNKLALAPDASVIATGNREGTVWLWDTEDGTELAALDGPADEVKWVSSLAYHPSGQMLASAQWADENFIHIWDLESQSIVQTIVIDANLGNIVDPMDFSPDGSKLACISKKDNAQHITIWDIDNGTELSTFEVAKNAKDISFSSDGLLAVASQYETSIYDIDAGKALFTLPQTFDESVSDWNIAVTFTPDNKHVAVVKFDGTAEMWQLPGAEPLAVPPVDIRTPPPLPGDVLFDTNSSDLKEAAFPELEALAEELFDNFSSAKITFIGHTDSRGSDADNQKLSLDRAEAIKTWFSEWAADNGADGWTLETDGLGSSDLKVPDVDNEGTFLEEAGALNRRVEIELDDID